MLIIRLWPNNGPIAGYHSKDSSTLAGTSGFHSDQESSVAQELYYPEILLASNSSNQELLETSNSSGQELSLERLAHSSLRKTVSTSLVARTCIGILAKEILAEIY